MGYEKNKIQDEQISRKLVNTYSDSIVLTDDGQLDFENSVYGIAVAVCDNMSDAQQWGILGERFENYDDAYDYIISHVQSLREELEKIINN